VGGGSDSGLEVVPYSATEEAEWDALVARSRSAHFFFRRSYMEYHADRFEDASLLVRDGAQAVALLPASRDGDLVSSHGGLTFGGLIGGEELTARRTLAALEAVLEYLRGEGAEALVYKAVPHIYHAIPAEEDLYALFRHGAALTRRDCSAALRPQQRPRYSKGRRAALARARKAELEVGTDPALEEFMRLEDEALRRRHGVAPVHSPKEIALLASRFPDNIKLFTARAGGELLAGVIVYETEVVAHTQYIAGTERGYAEHAVDAVIEFLIEDEYAGKRWFDFGISTTEQGRDLNTGLIRNKESYGARAVAYDTYRIELAG
jgi:GNAT acetyltransferase-like protein